jgi:hypothetical protein
VLAAGPVRGKMTPIRISFWAYAMDVKENSNKNKQKLCKSFFMIPSLIL